MGQQLQAAAEETQRLRFAQASAQQQLEQQQQQHFSQQQQVDLLTWTPEIVDLSPRVGISAMVAAKQCQWTKSMHLMPLPISLTWCWLRNRPCSDRARHRHRPW
jgi:hypothetical protein